MKLITLLLLLLSLGAFAQTGTYNQGGPAQKNYYCEIPFENIYGKLFLNVELAGKKHRFLFDTGSPVFVTPELAAGLKAKVLTKAASTDAYMHTDTSIVVQVNGIKLGDITFNGIPAISASPDFYKCYGIDGVIGSNLLRKSIVSIDNKRHVIILTDQADKLHLDPKNSMPFSFKEGPQSDPVIHMVMANKLDRNNPININIPFDTGDEDFIRIGDNEVSQLNKYSVFDTLAKGYGASALSYGGLQDAATKYLYKVAPFMVGNAQFYNLTIESNKETIPAIGSKLLNYGTVTLDYINEKFYFDAYTTVNDLTEKHWPVDPAFVNNKFIIGMVWDQARLLLKPGEQIMAVNDKDCSNITMCDLLQSGPGLHADDLATLTLKNAKGEIRKVTIRRR
ncbi:aspartyl protease family protein [Mucilaginibacter sp. dw_454]|uniref:retropepsin-like aspartic protease n=1 Tax=Mucilaginibacter sp. dw_454 TaxID=2720079 RepID=UPI001BD3AC02|nr:aspartyl protease family protein [Mucilaginibacter sp. dw_454]